MKSRQIQPNMLRSLRSYIDYHRPVGDFLTAVLMNDLIIACHCADSDNLPLLPIYVEWLHWNAPAISWGSPERVRAWLDNTFHGEQSYHHTPHEENSR